MADASKNGPPPLRPGIDYYIEYGRWVFTSAYHLNRGTCCGNGCRHCPYVKPPQADDRGSADKS